MKKTFDKNAEKFVALMVEKIESMSENWQKPWFYKGKSLNIFIPQNLTGRYYSGGNVFLLYFLCEKYNYQTPVFLTFNQARKEGIKISKGSISFPVYYTMLCAYERNTNEKISFEDYRALSEEDKANYRLSSYTQYYHVFNIDQTDFATRYPQKWKMLKEKFLKETDENNNQTKGMYVNPILDAMNESQSWVCPISIEYSDSAFYSLSTDSITLPLKKQFLDGENFYATELHEMGHSTDVNERLNRKHFYDRDIKSYGREELVAELVAALMGLYLGISVSVRKENAAYLKTWCKSIGEEPKFLFSVLADAIKAVKYISRHLNISLELENEQSMTDVA